MKVRKEITPVTTTSPNSNPKPENQIPVACFAPELTDKKLEEYKTLIDSVLEDKAELKDVLNTLYTAVMTWWVLPDSKKSVKRWEFNTTEGTKVYGEEQLLDDEHVQKLWEVTPWMRELIAMEPLLDSISPTSEKSLRDCAYHLLWHCKELTLDREPMTSNKLKDK
jgi:hypothetical protein